MFDVQHAMRLKRLKLLKDSYTATTQNSISSHMESQLSKKSVK